MTTTLHNLYPHLNYSFITVWLKLKQNTSNITQRPCMVKRKVTGGWILLKLYQQHLQIHDQSSLFRYIFTLFFVYSLIHKFSLELKHCRDDKDIPQSLYFRYRKIFFVLILNHEAKKSIGMIFGKSHG